MRKNNRGSLLLLGTSYGTGNLGVSALAEGTIEGLSGAGFGAVALVAGASLRAAAAGEDCRGGEVSFAFEGVRFSPRALGPDHIGVLWAKAFLLHILPFECLRARLIGRSTALQTLVEADAVLDISGGDSFADIYGARRMVYQFAFKLLPLILGKKLVLLPQTIGPFRRYPWRALARFVLGRSALIYSRDETGVGEVVRFMRSPCGGRVRFAPDVAFLVRPELATEGTLPAGRGDRARMTVGMNVNALMFNGGYTRRNQFGLKADYGSAVLHLLRELLTQVDVRVLLVPHVITSWRGGVENDEEACRSVHAGLPRELRERTEVVYGLRSAGGAKAVIGTCDFFIGSRMHSCIAALSQCIPTVGIAYSGKFRGVFESLGVAGCVADARWEDEEGILRITRDALARRDEIRTTLAQTVPIVQEQVRSAFRDIVELVSNGR